MSDTKQITIQGVSVAVTTPYGEGHTCSAAEAAALNQVRAENIRNNKASDVKKLKEEHPDDEKALQAAVEAVVAPYDAEYEFTLASVGGGGRTAMSPVEKEARSIARDYINAELKKMGKTQKAYAEENGEDAIKTKIAEFAQHPKIVALAEKAIADREANAKVAKDLSL